MRLHSGAADEVGYHEYHTAWSTERIGGGQPRVGPFDLEARAERPIIEAV
jgi:hypothetical protein